MRRYDQAVCDGDRRIGHRARTGGDLRQEGFDLVIAADRPDIHAAADRCQDLGSPWGSVLRVVAGGAPGDRSLVRTLEVLAIGVQDKRCLWRAAQTLVALPHPPGRRNFIDLEADEVRRWETQNDLVMRNRFEKRRLPAHYDACEAEYGERGVRRHACMRAVTSFDRSHRSVRNVTE